MKAKLFLASCLLHFAGFAQQKIDVDKMDRLPVNAFFSVEGQPIVNAKFVRLTEGTPYFKDQWLSGKGLTANNAACKSAAVKLDLLDNEVHYLDAVGAEMVATTPLVHLFLTDSLTGRSWHFVHSSRLAAPLKKAGICSWIRGR